jgi:prevent-host-death family protein
MSINVSLDEAQARLREIIARLNPGDEVVITENDRPVAKLVTELPAANRGQRPAPGLCKGMITIVSDDEEHLEDFDEYM